MILKKLSYSEFKTQPSEWVLDDCTFGNINLIVGKNATGKTRTLNVIRNLAGLLSELDALQWSEGNYSVEFSKNDRLFDYFLEYSNKVVIREVLRINNIEYITRNQEGIGKIRAEQLGDDIQFQTEPNRLSLVAKRDSIQHPFIDEIYYWAQGVTKLDFGASMGQGNLLIQVRDGKNLGPETKLSIKDTEKVVALFLQGERDFSNEFKNAILSDMNYIGFEIEDIGVDSIAGMSIILPELLSSVSIGQPTGTYVKESDLQIRTVQPVMSQGMFRALSAFIQVNYGLLSKKSTCILIDDIGEGLDYSRSSSLVKRLIEKAEGTSIQLVMATNDRFIMNAVPLEYWMILTRSGGRISNFNYRNSKEMFDNFQDTGLNNFDLFSSGYYKLEK